MRKRRLLRCHRYWRGQNIWLVLFSWAITAGAGPAWAMISGNTVPHNPVTAVA